MQNIISIDFDPKNKQFIIMTSDNGEVSIPIQSQGLFKNATFYKPTGLEDISFDSINNIKSTILKEMREISKLIIENKENHNQKGLEILRAITENFSNSLMKNDFLQNLLNNTDSPMDIEQIKFYCYKDNLVNCYNSLFFNRYLGKDDIDFTTFSDYDEYNEVLSNLNVGISNKMMFCELNNLKFINHLCGNEVGDKVLCSFINELSAQFDDTLNIRYGGDEFIIIGNESALEDINLLLESESFLKILNESIPYDTKLNNINIFATVSKGMADIEIPMRVYHTEEIIKFKKDFSFSYHNALQDSRENKIFLKNKYEHNKLEIDNSTSIVEYQMHLNSKNNENLDSSELNRTLDSLIKSDGSININSKLKY